MECQVEIASFSNTVLNYFHTHHIHDHQRTNSCSIISAFAEFKEGSKEILTLYASTNLLEKKEITILGMCELRYHCCEASAHLTTA
jgi:hypothetical protein